ncbi:MAG: cell division protein FtsK [Blastocatellia bacterium]
MPFNAEMKICPNCKQKYDDETNFCLSDGSTLVPDKGSSAIHSRVNEVVAVALVSVALLIFLCLVTASPEDRSIVSTGYGGNSPTKNWIGVIGANIAALLVSAIGWTAYLVPALIVLIAWRVYRSVGFAISKFRATGYLLFLVSLSGIAYLIDPRYGGLIGGIFPFLSVKLIGLTGTVIVLTAFFVSGLLLITNFTFQWLFGHFDEAYRNFKVHYHEWREKKRLASRAKIDARVGPYSVVGERTDADISDTVVIGNTIAIADRSKTRIVSSAATGEIEITPASSSVSQAVERAGEVITDTGSEKAVRNEQPLESETSETWPQPKARKSPAKTASGYEIPSAELLNPPAARIEAKEAELRELADSLVEKTREFNVAGRVVNISPGPVVTTFEFKPDPGVKYSRVTGLVDDLCLALKAESIRIDRIPGKAYVGIEVPNRIRETIVLREIVDSPEFRKSPSLLTIALGKTIDGRIYVSDLAKMPHLLIAGATGAGKSVGVNSLVMSILFKASPDEVKFIMVDPKRLELGLYSEIPHLAAPIITDPKRAASSLKWAVSEMERRYKDLAGWAVRNIDGYNNEVRRRNAEGLRDEATGEPFKTLPYIVIIIDELADLMMVSGREVEESITRLAQMARAVGIHLVLATQRPSVDVITGLIKANFPARISYRVSSKVDSRTIIDCNGAEALLGRGDMLFLPPASSQVIRIHGAFVDEKEIGRVVAMIKAQGEPEYNMAITTAESEAAEDDELPGRRDELFWEALKAVTTAKRASTSLLQRQLRIGYGRAAAILDSMVREGYIGEMDGSTRARPVLPKAYEDLADLKEMGKI